MMRPYQVGPIQRDSESHTAASGDPTLDQDATGPSRNIALIEFDLPDAGHVELFVYDLQGRKIRTLAGRTYASGSHQVTWDGRDAVGNPMANGIYFYALRIGMSERTGRIVLVR
jgi:flagellar hook assembly protein FlgD